MTDHPTVKKIHAFCTGEMTGPTQWGNGDVMGIALDDDGFLVSQHYCSGPGYAEKDMASTLHQLRYEERYPDGYEYEWYGQGEERLPAYLRSKLQAHREDSAQ